MSLHNSMSHCAWRLHCPAWNIWLNLQRSGILTSLIQEDQKTHCGMLKKADIRGLYADLFDPELIRSLAEDKRFRRT